MIGNSQNPVLNRRREALRAVRQLAQVAGHRLRDYRGRSLREALLAYQAGGALVWWKQWPESMLQEIV